MLGKRYNHKELQTKWNAYWRKNKTGEFDLKDRQKPAFTIDTPPPFTSGTLHMGHTLNHAWIDFVARYKRMKGYNVFFPQGFDCHGLPTELKVEKKFKVKKSDREKFREKCKEWTAHCIRAMKQQFDDMGYSADWRYEYHTMDDDYKARVQYSLLELFRKGMVYRKEHPTHWCTKCRTAIANAELGYAEIDGHLWHIKFKVEGGKEIVIATTRPELTSSCVAIFVHPKDRRYKGFAGKEATLPLLKRKVPILEDDKVDMEFGTGAVFLCTFGDEQDMKWQLKYELPVIISVGWNGRMTEAAGEYEGLKAKEAREKIVEDLKKHGALANVEQLKHNVLVHAERSACQTPIELIPAYQWFIKVKDKTGKIAKAGGKMKWHPDYMLRRLEDWSYSLDWDWVISRQRVWGTPIPFWFCSCGEIIPAKLDQLPVDPVRDKPPASRCPKCGSKELLHTDDVCDCWVDSSLTPLVAAQWRKDGKLFKQLYPTAMRSQGTDIIRTWLFYTIFRCLELTGKKPFDEVLINGMVHGSDGRKMSKSFGNTVQPDEQLEKYGADALRQWAARSGPGSDFPFALADVEYAHKFLTKFWNAARFSLLHLGDFKQGKPMLDLADRWILTKLSGLVKTVSGAMQEYNFVNAITPIQQFVWHDLCDNYIEMAKHRLYGEKNESRRAAQYTLYTCIRTALQLLAPISPFFSEEVYSQLPGSRGSILLTGWPGFKMEDKQAVAATEAAVQVISHLRKWKGDHSLSMNAEIREVKVYGPPHLKLLDSDLKGTMNVKKISYQKGKAGLDKLSDSLYIQVSAN